MGPWFFPNKLHLKGSSCRLLSIQLVSVLPVCPCASSLPRATSLHHSQAVREELSVPSSLLMRKQTQMNEVAEAARWPSWQLQVGRSLFCPRKKPWIPQDSKAPTLVPRSLGIKALVWCHTLEHGDVSLSPGKTGPRVQSITSSGWQCDHGEVPFAWASGASPCCSCISIAPPFRRAWLVLVLKWLQDRVHRHTLTSLKPRQTADSLESTLGMYTVRSATRETFTGASWQLCAGACMWSDLMWGHQVLRGPNRKW